MKTSELEERVRELLPCCTHSGCVKSDVRIRSNSHQKSGNAVTAECLFCQSCQTEYYPDGIEEIEDLLNLIRIARLNARGLA